MKLIVGLGNPGKKYEVTRHNAGFLFNAWLARKNEASFTDQPKFLAHVAQFKHDRANIILANPQTFMNESGMSVRSLMDFYKLTLKDVLVVHDDKDIPIGQLRLQTNRGPAGHNGVRSIISHVGSQDFLRLRLGIAPKDQKIENTPQFVLDTFLKDEMILLQETFTHALSELPQFLDT